MVDAGNDHSTTTSLLGPAAATAGLPEPEIKSTIRSAFRTATPHRSAGPSRPTSTLGAVGL
ncbi:MAG: hypothetical protein ACSLE3_14410 [Microbacteriaceae bacterium]